MVDIMMHAWYLLPAELTLYNSDSSPCPLSCRQASDVASSSSLLNIPAATVLMPGPYLHHYQQQFDMSGNISYFGGMIPGGNRLQTRISRPSGSRTAEVYYPISSQSLMNSNMYASAPAGTTAAPPQPGTPFTTSSAHQSPTDHLSQSQQQQQQPHVVDPNIVGYHRMPPTAKLLSATTKIRGLPYRTKPQDILGFFQGYQVYGPWIH
jgi:hypothetical protein